MKYLNPPRVRNLSPKKPTQKQTGWRLKFSPERRVQVCMPITKTYMVHQLQTFNWAQRPPKYRVNILFWGMLLNKNLWKKNTICEFVQQTNHLLGEKSNWGIGCIYFFHPVWLQQNKKIKRCKLHTREVFCCDFKPMTFVGFNAALLKNRRPKRCTGATEPVCWGSNGEDGKSASDLQSLLDTCHGTLILCIYYMQFLGRSLKYGSILLYIKSMLRINNSHI